MTTWAALVLGFVAGSVFWHFVGFWDFVGRAVFYTPTIANVGNRDLTTGSIARLEAATPITIADCLTLVRDPISNAITETSCPAGSVPTRFGAAVRRGDRAHFGATGVSDPAIEARNAPAVAGWSAVTTEPSTGRSGSP